MTQILLPSSAPQRLTFFLAMEEYVAMQMPRLLAGHCLSEEGAFFLWTVPPTVIYGRHQVLENEVNVPYCKAHHISVVQRKSGGGCVYADQGNLMLSYVSPSLSSQQVFLSFMQQLAATLQQMGIPAVRTEHNDILVDGRKVSGNACYTLKTATVAHGTLLYDVNLIALTEAIRPPVEKLQRHAVDSVRQRVLNLSPILSAVGVCSIDELQKYILSFFCSSSFCLSVTDLSAILSLEKQYA